MKKRQGSSKVTVWCAMSKYGLIGPYFFSDNVNAVQYLEMLNNFFIPSLKQLRKFSGAYFQQDGAPPHFATDVRALLDRNFNQIWIGRSGPITWPVGSPDLSALDFFLWGYIKNNVYKRVPTNLNQLKDFIAEEFQTVTRDMCENAMNSFYDGLNKCVGSNELNVD